MRKWINLFESIDNLTAAETKFWYSARENRFVDHDLDTHHTKMLATQPVSFNMTADDVSHHPHATGEYDEYDEFGDNDDDADDDDMGLFDIAFEKGWVRGGHFIDTMQYHEFEKIDHDGGIYLQGGKTRDLQKCAKACMKRWPDIEYFSIESDQRHFDVKGWEAIDRFIKSGTTL